MCIFVRHYAQLSLAKTEENRVNTAYMPCLRGFNLVGRDGFEPQFNAYFNIFTRLTVYFL